MRWMLFLIVVFAAPLAAQGDGLPDGGVTAPEVAAVLRQAGYPADMTADRGGGPLIRSSTGKVLFTVRLYQCSAELRCATVEFAATYRHRGVPPAVIAAWNRDKRFGRAFQDRSGMSWIAMDVETSHGVTTEALEANLTRWISVLNTFESLLAG